MSALGEFAFDELAVRIDLLDPRLDAREIGLIDFKLEAVGEPISRDLRTAHPAFTGAGVWILRE